MIGSSDLDRLAALKPNWDSYGSVPPDERALALARLLVDSMAVVPLPDGGVQIEMRCPGLDLDVGFGLNGFYAVDVGVDSEAGEVHVSEGRWE